MVDARADKAVDGIRQHDVVGPSGTRRSGHVAIVAHRPCDRHHLTRLGVGVVQSRDVQVGQTRIEGHCVAFDGSAVLMSYHIPCIIGYASSVVLV